MAKEYQWRRSSSDKHSDQWQRLRGDARIVKFEVDGKEDRPGYRHINVMGSGKLYATATIIIDGGDDEADRIADALAVAFPQLLAALASKPVSPPFDPLDMGAFARKVCGIPEASRVDPFEPAQ